MFYSVDSGASFLLGRIRNKTARNSPRNSSSPSMSKRLSPFAFSRVQSSLVFCVSMRTERTRTLKRARLSRAIAASWNPTCHFSPLPPFKHGKSRRFPPFGFSLLLLLSFLLTFFYLDGVMVFVQYKGN
jgi:hypothetical protein